MASKAGDTIDVAGYEYLLICKDRKGTEWVAYRVAANGDSIYQYVIRGGGRWKIVGKPKTIHEYDREMQAARAVGVAASSDALKAEGMFAALSSDAGSEWAERARVWVWNLSLDVRFTSEDIVEAIGLPRGDVGSNQNNAVGGTMNAIARAGLARSTGEYVKSKRPSSHSAVIALWVRTGPERNTDAGNDHADGDPGGDAF